jgi:hypothetical protein
MAQDNKFQQQAKAVAELRVRIALDYPILPHDMAASATRVAKSPLVTRNPAQPMTLRYNA